MRFYIVTDLEGPAGVNRWAQTREGDTPLKRAAMKLLTAEVNAAIDGILEVDSGAEVVVWDGHGDGGLLFEEIHDRAETIMRGSGQRAPYGLDASFDGLFFVGQHAMAGTPEAPLCHTYSSRTVERYRLNGREVGEFTCLAAMAGELGVPAIFLAGDDKACLEALASVPGIVTATTKHGMGIELARHLSPARSRLAIRAGAAEAVRRIPAIPPYRPDPPFELEIRVLEGCSIDGYLQSGCTAADDRTVRKQGSSVVEVMR